MIDALIRKRSGQFSLDARLSGEGFICITGRNGSGKTTLLRTIAGLTGFDEGYVKVDSREVSSLPAEARRIVMVTPSSSMLHLDVNSHILWGATLRGSVPPKDRVDEIKSSLGIGFSGQVRRLSLGMKERVCLATALLSSARVILVDEAFANLHDREVFMGLYRELARKAGVDVVFSSLDRSDGRLADHLFLIEDGKTERVA